MWSWNESFVFIFNIYAEHVSYKNISTELKFSLFLGYIFLFSSLFFLLLSCSVINTTTTSFLDYISFYFMFIFFLFLVASYQNHLHVWHTYVEIVLPVDYSQLRLLNDHFLSHQLVLLNLPKIMKIFLQMRWKSLKKLIS